MTEDGIPTHTAALLDDIKSYLSRFVVYPSDHELNAHALWIAHAWLMECWESTPRIAFLSPEPGSGKSRALEVTEPLVPRPVHAVNTTPAYLFRKVSDPGGAPTILYDEIDCVFGPKAKEHEDTRGMLNAGHRKGATAGRCVVRGKTVETEELPAYCAVALAGLDDLPDTIMTRSIVVRMRRRAVDEQIEPWRPRVNGPEATVLYTRLAKWSTRARELLSGDFWPEMPYGVEDRDADCWEALLAVADLAGDRWAKAARVTAVTLVRAAKRRPPTIGVLLLRDIKKVFDTAYADKLPTEEITNGLAKIPESPWSTIRKGEPIDDRGLALRLGKYGIGSKALRDGLSVFKGYSRAQFVDAWKRYVDQLVEDDEPTDDGCGYQGAVTSVTAETSGAEPNLFATAVTDVTDARQADRQCACGAALALEESIDSGQCMECAMIGGAS
ncbi:DUF3631 domain-containing protein [Mycobacterium sp. IEC1808]|uniref:DUF3631 domain-containing protein n=1 Tax=Mycobacterium sp. IEC1808 TaxID=1743230 RepID=UPI000A15D28D|nr:DUF3631 domain-containing protein [Mycobacterium sp. IEC1808]